MGCLVSFHHLVLLSRLHGFLASFTSSHFLFLKQGPGGNGEGGVPVRMSFLSAVVSLFPGNDRSCTAWEGSVWDVPLGDLGSSPLCVAGHPPSHSSCCCLLFLHSARSLGTRVTPPPAAPEGPSRKGAQPWGSVSRSWREALFPCDHQILFFTCPLSYFCTVSLRFAL